MGISGNSRALPNLAKAMQTMSTQGLARITKATAEEAKRQVTLGFRESRDPEGKPWAPLTSRTGQPLRKSGRLQNSFTTAVRSDTSFTIGSNVMYAGTHQYGATIVPKRGNRLVFQVQSKQSGGK